MRKLILSTSLLIATLVVASAQQTTIGLVVENSQKAKLTLQLGVHPKATYCLDAELGEMEMPPVPPAILFEARFLEVRRNSSCFGNGSYKDFRKQAKPSQIDTYKVTINPGEHGFPLKLHWNPIRKFFNHAVQMKLFSDGSQKTIDMTRDTVATITEEASDAGSPIRVTIITGQSVATKSNDMDQKNSSGMKPPPAKSTETKKKAKPGQR